jgi:hypothetical protein
MPASAQNGTDCPRLVEAIDDLGGLTKRDKQIICSSRIGVTRR